MRSRARLGIGARLMLMEGVVPCRIDNLSIGGARLQLDVPLKLGCPGILTIHDTEAFGEVVWQSRGRAGFKFDELLEDSEVVRLRYLAPKILLNESNHVEIFAQQWVEGRA